MSLPPPVCWRMSCQISTSLFSYNQLHEAQNAHFRRPILVVFNNVLTPVIRDSDILVRHMIQRMLQMAIKISIPRRHIEHSIAWEARHSSSVSAFLALFRVRLGLLLAVVTARGCLAAFIYALDSPVGPYMFRPVPNGIVGALAIVPRTQMETGHT